MGCDPPIAVVRRKFATGCTAVVHAENLNLDIVMAKLEDRVSTSDFGLMNRTGNQHIPMQIRFPTRIVENRPAYVFRIQRRCNSQKR